MNHTTYRKLTDSEINTLTQNHCDCDNWGNIEVTDRGFQPKLIRNCSFRGIVRLGADVYIDGVREKIANYTLEDRVTIKNCESIVTVQSSSFGNGVRVSVLNESGGREIPIYNGLNAQIAYIAAMFRHKPEIIAAINRMVDLYAEEIASATGTIGKGSVITNCGPITNVCTGPYTVIRGASELINGTINSSRKAQTIIGRDVIARNFIIADSAEVTDVAFIEKCYVGQGCKIGKGFTAVDTLFFANCDCQQGEACAVFAGPFTVTHHKSTLLISAMVSFFNAGSGSNQSNHMYRLGPMHQGVLERGCKSGSNSYILFPTRIGAFSVINGRHYKHTDTSALPFSRLLEEDKDTVIIPGIMLKSIGTARDANKWEKRDRRKGDKNDIINFEILTPYTVSKIRAGIEALNTLDPKVTNEYNRIQILPRGIEIGLEAYTNAVNIFIGDTLTKKLEQLSSPQDIRQLFAGETYERWSDLSGMILPTRELGKLLEQLEQMNNIQELSERLSQIAQHYDQWRWDYAISILSQRFGKPLDQFNAEDYILVLEKWIESQEKAVKCFIEDTAKEYDPRMMTGYGMEGDANTAWEEFTMIHGSPEANPFLKKIKSENTEKIDLAKEWIETIRGINFG